MPFRDTVKLLGVTLDSALSMDRHVTEVIRSCSYHTRALRHIRPLLTLDVAKSVGHSIVASRLDYANALLHCTSTSNLHRLQVAQNSLARAVSGTALCQCHRVTSTAPLSPVAEEPNLAMSGNNRFSAFFSSLYNVVQESVGCTDFPLLAFSEFKMASNML